MGCRGCGGGSRSTTAYQATVHGGMVRVLLVENELTTGSPFTNVRGQATKSNYGNQVIGREFCIYKADYEKELARFTKVKDTC